MQLSFAFFLLVAVKFTDSFQLKSRACSPVRYDKTELYQSNTAVKKMIKFGASLIISGSLFNFPVPSNAQIPSMDEYNTGSGTVLPGRGKKVVAPVAAATATAPTVFTVSGVKKAIIDIDKYISEDPAKWDEITREINLIPKYSAKNFGLASSADVASNFKITAAQAKNVESAREDFAFNFGLLKDLALANRAYFFNKADLEQQELIKEAAEPPSKAAVKEAKDIIVDIKSSFTTLEESLTP